MQKNFVTVEQAKLLKELGFDQYCDHVYNSEGTFHITNILSFDYRERNNYYGAPTLSQVQEWLRVEKNVLIYPYPDSNYGEDINGIIIHYLTDIWDYELWINGKDETPCNSCRFTNPREALLNGIDEWIKKQPKLK